MRNEKGITLVALILIIVVLVILAGISISLVVNNEADKLEIDPKGQVTENIVDNNAGEVVNPETENVEEDVVAGVVESTDAETAKPEDTEEDTETDAEEATNSVETTNSVESKKVAENTVVTNTVE